MTLELAEKYISNGIPIIPIPSGQKAPNIPDWPNLDITLDNVSHYFSQAQTNIAVKLGLEDSNIVDLDLDCEEAVIFGNIFAPETTFKYGRVSKPNSHMLYSCKDLDKPLRFEIPGDGMLLEVRSKGQLTILPGSIHPSGEEYEPMLFSKSISEVSYTDLRKQAALIATACAATRYWPGKGMRQNAALALSGFLCKVGCNTSDVLKVIRLIAQQAKDDEPDMREKAAKASIDKYNAGESVIGITALKEIFPENVTKAISKWFQHSIEDEIESAVLELNEKHAFIIMGGSHRVMITEKSPVTGENTISYMKLESFKALHKTDKICVDYNNRKGTIYKTIAELWLEHSKRLTYEKMMFEPGLKLPNRIYNYWQGFSVEPVDNPDSCHLFLDHLKEIICGGNAELYKWVLGYIADIVQNPGKKPGTAIVLRGPQGAGKSFFADYLCDIFKPHCTKVNNSKHLSGNFNSHQYGTVLVICEEGFLAGDKTTQGVLKDFITSDQMNIERKGVDIMPAKNCSRLMIISNHDIIIDAATDDRRYAVIDVSDKVAQNHDYFSKLYTERKNGGPAALLDFLMKHDYSTINLYKAPQTPALVEQKIEALSGTGKFIYDCLSKGYIHPQGSFWPEWIETDQFFDLCLDFSKKIGAKDRSVQTQIGKKVKFYLGDVPKSKKLLPRRDLETGAIQNAALGNDKFQQLVYELPTLQKSRSYFTQKTGIPFDYDTHD